MSDKAAYFAHGHPSQHDAYQWLFAPPEAEPQLHSLFEYSDVFGDTGGAKEDAVSAGIGGLFTGFNLHNAVIVYFAKHRALLIRRPEMLSRGGFLREGILCPTSQSEPVMRYVSALAPKPSINQLEQANQQLDSKLAEMRNVRPLLKMFSSTANAAALKTLLARVVTAFAQKVPGIHLCIVLPSESVNMIMPLGLALDEMLPGVDRRRGFVLCTSAVTSFNAQIAERLDFSLFCADPRRNIPKPSENVAICDLRLQPDKEPAMVTHLEQLFSQGGDAVEAFAQWTQRRLSKNGWAQLSERFWQRLAVRSDTKSVKLEQLMQTLSSNPLETLDRKSFLALFHAAASQRQNTAARNQIINTLKPAIQKQPAAIGWLLQQDVLQYEDAVPIVSQFFDELHRPGVKG